MTAEISILNQNGIILAADSASTIGGNKVYNTANKIFTLSQEHSVGLMIYGAASFMNVSWEIIIEKFKKYIGRTRLDSVETYGSKLIDFIKQDISFYKEPEEEMYLYYLSSAAINYAFNSSEEKINIILKQNGKITPEEVGEIVTQTMMDMIEHSKEQDNIFDYDFEKFKINYGPLVIEELKKISENDIVTNLLVEPSTELVYNLLIKENELIPHSGIVIGGYGNDDVFPSILSYKFYAFFSEHLKYTVDKVAKISNKNGELKAQILPFAQDDVVHTVIQGMDPQISRLLAELKDQFDDDNKIKYINILEYISKVQKAIYIDPILEMIISLPVSETAVIAETLINLTSFKRKYSNSVETVGGPIDVLSITYSDGPIWIKRKHYFELNKNLDYKFRKENIL